MRKVTDGSAERAADGDSGAHLRQAVVVAPRRHHLPRTDPLMAGFFRFGFVVFAVCSDRSMIYFMMVNLGESIKPRLIHKLFDFRNGRLRINLEPQEIGPVAVSTLQHVSA